jgi:hypothetical protein
MSDRVVKDAASLPSPAGGAGDDTTDPRVAAIPFPLRQVGGAGDGTANLRIASASPPLAGGEGGGACYRPDTAPWHPGWRRSD